MPTRRYHSKEGTGRNTMPVRAMSGGHRGLGMTEHSAKRRGRRGRRK